jgi:hypothetical protein
MISVESSTTNNVFNSNSTKDGAPVNDKIPDVPCNTEDGIPKSADISVAASYSHHDTLITHETIHLDKLERVESDGVATSHLPSNDSDKQGHESHDEVLVFDKNAGRWITSASDLIIADEPSHKVLGTSSKDPSKWLPFEISPVILEQWQQSESEHPTTNNPFQPARLDWLQWLQSAQEHQSYFIAFSGK